MRNWIRGTSARGRAGWLAAILLAVLLFPAAAPVAASSAGRSDGFPEPVRSTAAPDGLHLTGGSAGPGAVFYVQRDGTPAAYSTRPAGSLTRFAFLPAAAYLSVYPKEVAAGGTVRLAGQGFPPGLDLVIYLSPPSRPAEPIALAMLQANEAGDLGGDVPVPAGVAPGSYTVGAWDDSGPLAEATLDVRAALTLEIAPPEGPPGTTVEFTVSNLVAGSLRLDYSGAAVVGPIPVGAGVYSGSFVVPGDRPDPLGSPATVLATNLVVGLAVGQAELLFESLPGEPPPVYSVADLLTDLDGVAPGGGFTIRGRIDPPPADSAGFKVLPIWRTAGGKVFPVGAGPARIAPDGSFEVPAHVPGLGAGDPFPPQDGDQAGVALIEPKGVVLSNLFATGNFWLYPGLEVKAVIAGSNPPQQIAEAVITVSDWPVQVGAGSLSQKANAIFTGAANQIAGSNSEDGELTEAEKTAIELQKAACPIIGVPTGSTDLVISVVYPPLEENLSQPSALSQMLVNTQLTTVSAAASGPAAQTAADAPETGTVLHYLVTVDAIAQGYAGLDADNLPRTTSFRVDYHTTDKSWRDPQGNLLPSPILVSLPPIPDWAKGKLGEVKAFFKDLTPDPETTPGATPTFSRYYSLVGLPPGIAGPTTTSARVTAILSTAQKALLATNGLKLYVDGVLKGTANIQYNTGVVCTMLKGPKVVSNPFYVATFDIPNPHLLTPGIHNVRIGATLAADLTEEIHYDYKLRVEGLPASWFAVQNQGTRSIEWKTLGVTFWNGWLSDTGSKQTITSGTTTPSTGPLDNDTRANVTFTQSAQANGNKSTLTNGKGQGKALNKEGGGAGFSGAAGAVAVAAGPASSLPASSPSAVSQEIKPTKDVLVPTVTFDLPEAKYGIPFVAEVAAGGSVSYSASVAYGGQITVADDGSVQSVLSIDPESTVSGTVYVEGRLLTGLIGKAGASLTADFNLHMPVTYDTAKSSPLTAGTYFKYGADFKAWHKWGCVPYAGCAYSKTYTTHLFDGCQQLEGSTGCQGAAAAEAAFEASMPAAPGEGEPPQIDFDLATDGQGALMAIWPATRMSLATSDYDGNAWSPPAAIPTGVGSSEPQLAFLEPGRSLAVWVETTLPAGMPDSYYAGIPITDAVKSQRVAYSIWNGIGWSAAAPLTAPQYGEGNLALAACMNGSPGCPAGGAATAVWQRYVTEDLLQRQVRLFYATYQGGAWSAPQPVDPASTSTDILPQVAYDGGTPIILWVRDSDTDMTDVTSRRVALVALGVSPVIVPPTLPDAIGEIAMAVRQNGLLMLAFTRAEDGARLLDNRRPLWFATVACDADTCNWTPVQQRDPFGRTIYAERPILTLNSLDQPTITFRGMGFGPDGTGQISVQPGDPPGMTFNTGELAQLPPNSIGGVGVLSYMTQDGAVNWLPAAVFDPMSGSTPVLVVKGAAAVPQASAAGLAGAPLPDPALPAAFAVVPDLPDFAVTAVGAATPYPQPGEPLSVAVQVASQGVFWPGSDETPLGVVATWDGGPGVGDPAGQAFLTSLGDGGAITETIVLEPPPGTLDLPHTLTVTANPGQVIVEADGTNNSASIVLGGLPVPGGLVGSTQAGSGLAFLQWTPLTDGRIAGYRVYRGVGDGPLAPAGSSLTSGWVDPAASPGATYRYAITAFTEDGIESALSESVQVTASLLNRRYLPFVLR
jgi:hypothetical protein